MFSSCQMLLSHKLFCCQRAGNELTKWERGLRVVEISAPNVQFLTFCFCSVYLPIGFGGAERMVVEDVHLSHPGEGVCSDEKALCIQCLKSVLKIAHSTS